MGLHHDQDPRKDFSLAIVGGGLGGLCLAVALCEHKIPLHVYESAPSFSEIGAGVGLGPNALRAMALLSPAILQGYRRCETRNVSVAERDRFFNFRYGMQRPSEDDGMEAGGLIADLRSGTVTSSVHRARFLGELVRLLPGGVASCGKRVVGIQEEEEGEGREGREGEGEGGKARKGGVVLQFADGTAARHDAVIGCDGIKSQVRKALLGDDHPASKAVFSGKCCYRGLAPVKKAIEILGEDLALESQMYLGRHAHVLTTPIEQGQAINVVAYCTKNDGRWDDEQWIKPTTKEEMLAHFHGWSKPVMDILSLIEKPDIWALFDHAPAPTYHRQGRICLLGDAAHASTPHHGAGAGMAVEDALVLSKLLASIESRQGLEAAFAAYDQVRRPRSQRLVTSSRRVAEVYDFEDESTRRSMKKLGDYLLQAWDWIWKEDVEGQLERAQRCLLREATCA